jgi:vancomycin aglycone glucosyltransferase
VVCAPPDEEFVTRLAEYGMPLVPFGQSVRDLVTGPRPVDPPSVAAALVDEWFGPIAAAAEGCDVLVAGGLLPAGAPSVAEQVGARYVYVTFHGIELPSPNRPPSQRPGKVYPADEAANPVLWPREELTNLEVEQTGAWILPDVRPLAPELVAFLDAGEPPVYVGFGSMPMHAAKNVGQVAVDAVRAQGRRVLLASGWADLAQADDSDDCFVVGEVNQQALFRRVAAVVHHGGGGTTTTAARAGAPQVVVPQFVDQPYWARRVAELGIGAAHDGPVPTFESLSAALKTALAPEVRVRAAEVAGMVRTDGAAVAAKLLLG